MTSARPRDDDDDDYSYYERMAHELLSEWRQCGMTGSSTAPGGGEGVLLAPVVVVVDAWQLYRLGRLLLHLRDGGGGGGGTDHASSRTISSNSWGGGTRRRSTTTTANSLRDAAHDLVAALPSADRNDAFRRLHVGLVQLILPIYVRSTRGDAVDEDEGGDVDEAVRVLAELYMLAGDVAPTADDFRRHCRLSEAGASSSWLASIGDDDSIPSEDRALHLVISYVCHESTSATRQARDAVMKVVTRWVWTDRPTTDGTTTDNDDNIDDDHDDPASGSTMFSVLRTLQGVEAAWSDFVWFHDDRDENWRQHLLEHYQHQDDLDDDQVTYLSSLLHSTTTAAETTTKTTLVTLLTEQMVAAAASAPSRAPPPRESELDRRIRQVRQVLPDLGEGFVEAALSYYQGNVERTVSALLQETDGGGGGTDGDTVLPEALRTMDWSLPRRTRRQRQRSTSSSQVDAETDEEAIRITKSIVREADRRQEEEAYALQRVGGDEIDNDDLRTSNHDPFRNEYDDDYDDQYDDYQPRVDEKADSTDDYEAIRLYNRALKSVEREQVFWDQERNTNRVAQGRSDHRTNDDDAQDAGATRTYRGPDKLRGGRIPKDPRHGGRGGRGRDNSSTATAGRAVPSSNAESRGGGSEGRGGRGRGRGSGRGGSGGGGRGRGGEQPASGTTDSAAAPPPQQGTSSRAKANRLSNRREKQKQAAAKRVG